MPVGCLCLLRELWHLDYGHAGLFQQFASLAVGNEQVRFAPGCDDAGDPGVEDELGAGPGP
jgi:hypothetical protein